MLQPARNGRNWRKAAVRKAVQLRDDRNGREMINAKSLP
jgi:hypothetical protein